MIPRLWHKRLMAINHTAIFVAFVTFKKDIVLITLFFIMLVIIGYKLDRFNGFLIQYGELK